MTNKIISITGISASGKTHLAQALLKLISREQPHLSADVLEEDSYYKDQKDIAFKQRLAINYAHPDAIDHELLLEHLEHLKSGIPFHAPIYDYHQHTRREKTRKIKPVDLLIIPGTLLLYQNKFNLYFDFSIYIDCSLDTCLSRRINRDCVERGRTAEFVKEQFQRDVIPMYYEYLKPTRRHADLIVSGDTEVSSLASQVMKTLNLKKIAI